MKTNRLKVVRWTRFEVPDKLVSEKETDQLDMFASLEPERIKAISEDRGKRSSSQSRVGLPR